MRLKALISQGWRVFKMFLRTFFPCYRCEQLGNHITELHYKVLSEQNRSSFYYTDYPTKCQRVRDLEAVLVRMGVDYTNNKEIPR